MRRYLPVITAVVLVIVTGVVHGFVTNRWGSSEAITRAATALKNMPTRVGDWESEPVKTYGEGRLGLAAERYVRFTNKKTGDSVAVALVCGRPGPVCIHTPDVCYSTSGYTVAKKTSYEVKGVAGAPTFLTADMSKPNSADALPQRLFWCWRSEGKWCVADNPRIAFARQPVLYKFYLARDLSAPVPFDQEPILDLLRQLLPELDRVLEEGAS